MNRLRKLSTASSTALLGFFAVLAVISMTVPFFLGTASLGTAVDERMSESSRVTARAVAQEIRNLGALLANAAHDERFQLPEGLPGDVDNPHRKAVDSLRTSNVSLRTAAYLDITGKILVDSPLDANVSQNFAYRPYFTSAIANTGETYISDPFTAKLNGLPTLITVSQAVMSVDDPSKPIGVLVVGIDVNTVLKPFVDTFDDSNGVNVAIFDRAGKSIVGETGIDPLDPEFQKHLNAAISGISFGGTIGRGDNAHVLSLTPVESTGFVVAATADHTVAFGPLVRFQHHMIILAVLAGAAMLVCVLLLARTLRTRDRALREVQTAGKRTRLILETAGEAFIECNESSQITGWNTAAETMFGWSAEDALGRDVHLLLAPDWRRKESRTEVDQAFANFDGVSHARKAERPVVRKGAKEPFPGIVTAWVTDLDGERRMSFFIEDVTERRQLDAARELVFRRQRELVQELREADQTKNDFMSTVSHELRTPLTSILGYLEMLQEGYGGEFNKQATSMIDIIDRNANRLLGLIEDLLTLSRIESGSARTEASLVDLPFLIAQVEQALAPSVRERSLALVIDVPRDLPPVDGDSNQLERVFLNVLSNAVKFTPSGGQVRFKAIHDGQNVLLEISDTGVGIPLEEQHRLFSRFFRSSTARDQAIQGTGLGLTIVKSIVDRHHGSITVSSLPGVGTTVSIALPAAAERVVLQ